MLIFNGVGGGEYNGGQWGGGGGGWGGKFTNVVLYDRLEPCNKIKV